MMKKNRHACSAALWSLPWEVSVFDTAVISGTTEALRQVFQLSSSRESGNQAAEGCHWRFRRKPDPA